MSNSIDQVVEKIEKLPTINTLAFQVIQLCADNEIPIPRLVKLISSDQSLSSQVLRVANSSYFNYPRTIYSLDRAIVILGFNLLRDIAVSLSIYSLYKGFKANNFFSVKDLWRHSLITGFTMKCLAEQYNPEDKDLLYIGGLLHDIGKLAILKTLNKDYYFVLEKSKKESKRLVDIEQKFFGFNHADVGSELLERWNLPSSIVLMAKNHHSPDEFEMTYDSGSWVRLVYLGNLLAHLVEMEQRDIASLIQLDPHFTNYFSLSDTEVTDLIEIIENEINEQENYLQLFEVGKI